MWANLSDQEITCGFVKEQSYPSNLVSPLTVGVLPHTENCCHNNPLKRCKSRSKKDNGCSVTRVL